MFDRITIKYGGNYHEFPLEEMDVSLENTTDAQILNAVRQRLESEGIPVSDLDGYCVDPPESERLSGQHSDKTVLNVRPQATYGS